MNSVRLHGCKWNVKSWRWLAAFVMLWVSPASALEYSQATMLEKLVDDGKLPPLIERIPSDPRVIDLPGEGLANGRYGGDLRLLMGRTKDVRMMVVYGYARLVTYTDEFEIVPDILRDIEVEGEAHPAPASRSPLERWQTAYLRRLPIGGKILRTTMSCLRSGR